ncbi:MAG TPA: S66 peptidase family protein [Actinospica sp.]|nr:S66 peptidase family protein [Actinospica sp.]
MDEPRYPPKPRPGDRVAIVSPSGGLPELLPLPFDLGLRRLREDFQLIPVEYPGTRVHRSTPKERAADLHAAFADPDIKAVICSIGGDSQITVLPHLDAELLRANPKPFFGYSDATNLLTYLHTLGIVAYHGGAVMTQYGRAGRMHPLTTASLRAALFTSGPFDLVENEEFCDIDIPWDDPAEFGRARYQTHESSGWSWLRADRVVEAPSWGGNLEILSWLAMADRNIGDPARYEGGVLILETSEELPSHVEVYRILRNLGERGLLRRFGAALIGRPKAWAIDRRLSTQESIRFRADQRAAVERAFAEYNPDAMLVFDLEIGHTEPQVVVPFGGTVRVDGPARRITVTY